MSTMLTDTCDPRIVIKAKPLVQCSSAILSLQFNNISIIQIITKSVQPVTVS